MFKDAADIYIFHFEYNKAIRCLENWQRSNTNTNISPSTVWSVENQIDLYREHQHTVETAGKQQVTYFKEDEAFSGDESPEISIIIEFIVPDELKHNYALISMDTPQCRDRLTLIAPSAPLKELVDQQVSGELSEPEQQAVIDETATAQEEAQKKPLGDAVVGSPRIQEFSLPEGLRYKGINPFTATSDQVTPSSMDNPEPKKQTQEESFPLASAVSEQPKDHVAEPAGAAKQQIPDVTSEQEPQRAIDRKEQASRVKRKQKKNC